jgi:hypothetical protein
MLAVLHPSQGRVPEPGASSCFAADKLVSLGMVPRTSILTIYRIQAKTGTATSQDLGSLVVDNKPFLDHEPKRPALKRNISSPSAPFPEGQPLLEIHRLKPFPKINLNLIESANRNSKSLPSTPPKSPNPSVGNATGSLGRRRTIGSHKRSLRASSKQLVRAQIPS